MFLPELQVWVINNIQVEVVENVIQDRMNINLKKLLLPTERSY